MEPVFGGKFPVAAVTNKGKQVVSDDSSAAVILVALVAVVTVSPAICVSNAVPLTVIASASSVPSISASPEISKLAATTSPTVISGVPVNPAALPVQDPDEPEVLPVTLPVNGPTKLVAVIIQQLHYH